MWKVTKLKKWNMVHRFGKRVVKENYYVMFERKMTVLSEMQVPRSLKSCIFIFHFGGEVLRVSQATEANEIQCPEVTRLE